MCLLQICEKLGICYKAKMKPRRLCEELTLTCVFTFLLSWTSLANAYSQGAGSQACSSLTPWHSANQPQTNAVPYVITVSKTSYRPMEQIVGKTVFISL